MPTIVIANADTTLSVDQSHFTLRSSHRKVGRIPPAMIDQVVVHHGVAVTRAALDRLGDLGVPVTFLNQEGCVQARLVPAWKYDARPRLDQARVYFDTATRLEIARRLVDAKIDNGAAMIRLHAANHPHPAFSEACEQLQGLRQSLTRAADTPAIMGVEGAAGRAYFAALGRMLRVDWTRFEGRNRRPPRDPFNAALSYLYAVLTHLMLAYTEAVGLDPYIGCLHSLESRRPVLALDLIEPFRPVLGDRLALRLFNLGTLQPQHFHEAQGPGNGIFINYEGRMALLKMFGDWTTQCDEALGPELTSPGTLLRKEAEKYAALARTSRLEHFCPFRLRD